MTAPLNFTPAVGDMDFTPQQRELLTLAHTLGRDKFAPRAPKWDLSEGVLSREAGPQFGGSGDDEAAHAGTSVAPSSGMRAETCCMAAS